MQTKYKLNHSLFIIGLPILLFSADWLLVQAQTSPNNIVFDRRSANFDNSEIYTMKADGSNHSNPPGQFPSIYLCLRFSRLVQPKPEAFRRLSARAKYPVHFDKEADERHQGENSQTHKYSFDGSYPY